MSSLPPDYPVEYIEGKVRFFGRDFRVTPDVLIPRLETEGLVRRARQILGSNPSPEKGRLGGVILRGIHNSETPSNSPFSRGELNYKPRSIVDIGCGSGIIGTSVADLADEVIFLDISRAALRVAEENFRTHFPEKKAQFIVSDLLSALPISYLLSPISSLLFLTNLPYIKDEDWKNMSADTIHEPRLALFGGEKTGFELYERLFEQFAQLPIFQESSIVRVLYEFGFDQREVAEEIVKKYPHWEYSFFGDYAGVERFGEIIF